MTSIASLQTRLERMRKQVKATPENFLLSASWLVMRATILQAVEPYIDAQEALMDALEQVEQEGQVEQHRMHDAIAHALYPFIEARVSIADALVHADALAQKRKP